MGGVLKGLGELYYLVIFVFMIFVTNTVILYSERNEEASGFMMVFIFLIF